MIPLPSLVAAATDAAAEKTTIADALPHLAGFLVVLVTLAVLWGICAITGKVISSSFPQQEPPAKPAKPSAPPAEASEDAISPEILAVIAAAVHATVGPRRRIVSVHRHNPAWNQAGRQQILQSHQIR